MKLELFTRYCFFIFAGFLICQVVLIGNCCFSQEATEETSIRLANGVAVEGTFTSASPEGLAVQTTKGMKVLPWKYLSSGTRLRYEVPMLAEIEAKRIKAEKAAKAKAEAAAKAAAAKAAAAAAAAASSNKPPATAANANQPKITAPIPTPVVSNKPPSIPAAK